MNLVQKRVAQNDILYDLGDQQENPEFCFIDEGEIIKYVDCLNENASMTVLENLVKGNFFGQDQFFTLNPCNYSLKAVEFSVLYCIDRNKFLEILKKFPKDMETFFYIRDEMNLRIGKNFFNQKCHICKSNSHESILCCFVQL
jgi:CRP-like cAMP-binding protein